MGLNELAEFLESMSEQELSRYTRQCLCAAVAKQSLVDGIERQVALDMVYAECCRRGKARLYDMACESVAANPEVCNAA